MLDAEHLRNIRIRKFRGLHDLELADIGIFNIILGANNVGKTSVLEAIFVANTFADLRAFIGIQNTRNYFVDSFEDLQYFFYDLDIDDSISINLSLGSNQNRNFEISAPSSERVAENLLQVPGNRNIDFKPRPQQADRLGSRLLSYKMHIAGGSLLSEASFAGTLRIYNGEKFDQSEISENALQETIGTNLSLPRVGYDRQSISQLLVNKRGEDIVSILRFVDSKIRQLATGPKSIHVDIGLRSMMPLEMFGSGLVRATNIVSNCIGKSNKVELIDELEYGLHHDAIGEVVKAILTLSIKNNIQIFCTTHSIDVLAHIANMLTEEELVNLQPHVNCYVLARDENEMVRSYRYDYDQFDHCIEHGIEIR